MFFSLGLINAYSFLVVELFSDQTSAMFMFYVQIVRAISSFSQAPFYSHIPNFNQLYGEGKMNFPDSLDKPSRTIITGEGGISASRFKHVVKVGRK